MPKTLLAVDDSVTMRKVLEITFSGEDYRVVTADNAQSAFGKLAEGPSVFVIDANLGGEDGYALAKEMRQRNPGASILMLASRYAPYDQARGRDAGADDFADKPFDTQQLLDKVKKIVAAKESAGAGAGPGAPYRAPAAPARPAQPIAAPAGALGRGTQPSLGSGASRSATLMFGESPLAAMPQAQVPQRPAPPPPAPAAPIAAPPQSSPSVARVAGAVNGQLAPKLSDLGLSPQQVDAVMALSREVVERVVWEVVPQLAETLIREEIARLTKD